MSVYESQYDSKFNNDEYNSNAYECLKNIDGSNNNNTERNTIQSQPSTPAATNNVEGNRRRKYDYDTNCFNDDN